MKRILLSELVVVFLLTLTPNLVNAYQIEILSYSEVNAGGTWRQGIDLSNLQDQIHYDGGIEGSTSAGYRLLGISVDQQSGVITPDWEVYPGSSFSYNISANVQFQIISDYGSTSSQVVDVWVQIDRDGGAYTPFLHSPLIASGAYTFSNIDAPGYQGALGYMGPIVDSRFQIETNTPYFANFNLNAGGFVHIPTLPDSFSSLPDMESWLSLNSSRYRSDPTLSHYIDNNYWLEGDYVMAGMGISYFFTLVSIETAPSAVPEPATMLLFGAGLAGLAAAPRRKKTC